MSIPHTLTNTSVTVLGKDFVPKTMPHTHPMFDQVVTALNNNDPDTVYRLMDMPTAIADFTQGKIQVINRQLFFDGRQLHNSLATRILQFIEEGKPELAQPLINFLEKVKENPSYRATEGLYDWCVKSNLPIAPDGDILAWKIVRPDYMDIHSNTFDNSVGQVVEIERNEADEDPDRTCSYGLHFCSTEYLPHYYSNTDRRVMIVKIHPKDVVAFPRDYNTSKGRACRYEVIGEVPPEKAKEFFPSRVSFADFSQISDINTDPDGELPELELDSYYKTRDGRIVQIVAYNDGDEYPFVGDVMPSRGEQQTYGLHGSWNLYEDHPLDLVEELPGYDPDVQQPVVGEVIVGCKYCTRDGQIVEITEDDQSNYYPMLGNLGHHGNDCWQSDGRYSAHVENHPLDLVELIDEPAEERGILASLFDGLFGSRS